MAPDSVALLDAVGPRGTDSSVAALEEFTQARIFYLPAGLQDSRPYTGAGAYLAAKRALVDVTPESAIIIDQQFRLIRDISGDTPFFDLEHLSKECTFLPSKFLWRSFPIPGIYADGVLTKLGRAAIESGQVIGFSPEYSTGDGSPAKLVCSLRARHSFGGLTRCPANKQLIFTAINNPFRCDHL